MNTIKTYVLMLVMSGILLIAGFFTWGIPGIIIFLGIALVVNFFSYWSSDKLALKMSHAHEVLQEDEPELHQIVDDQTYRAGIPKPRVYLINNDSPNAFATGRNPKHAAIAVTTGIRRILNREELGAVIAHELAHVGNRDTLIMTMVATIAMAVAWIAFIAQFAMWFGGFGGRGRGGAGGYGAIVGIVGLLIVIIVLPIVATLVRLAISRAREYQADATGARTSGDPFALASALEKLEMGTQHSPMKVNEAMAHLYIVNPLKTRDESAATKTRPADSSTQAAKQGRGLSGLLSTHPPIQERARRLRDIRTGW